MNTCRNIGCLLLACPFALITLIFFGLKFNVKIPGDSQWLYNYQRDFRGKLIGDQLVGGGHYFMADGRDLWIRFRVQSSPPKKLDPQDFRHCSSEELKTVSRWFLDHAVHSKNILEVISLSDTFQQDREILSQPYHLHCVMDGGISHKFGEFPQDCGSWSLYDPDSQFYYLRYACYN